MLTHTGTQVITTPRLILRPFKTSDAEDMYENWASDPRVTRYLSWLPHTSFSDTFDLLTLWCEKYDQPNYYNWAIEYAGSVIGNISIVLISESNETGVFGYAISYTMWNNGLMYEALSAVTDYLFENVGFNRLRLIHAMENPASGRVAAKCGYICEGIHRQMIKLPADNSFHDAAEYAILRNDWALRKK